MATPLGKVIYNVPNNRQKMNLTYILQGAVPNKSYNVGFDVRGLCFANTPNDPPSSFGGVARTHCETFSGVAPCGPDTVGVYQIGPLTTDVDGDGDLHINLRELISDTYEVVFWVALGATSTSPVASTACFGDTLNYETITIP